jgi:hypothetical protein
VSYVAPSQFAGRDVEDRADSALKSCKGRAGKGAFRAFLCAPQSKPGTLWTRSVQLNHDARCRDGEWSHAVSSPNLSLQ